MSYIPNMKASHCQRASRAHNGINALSLIIIHEKGAGKSSVGGYISDSDTYTL